MNAVAEEYVRLVLALGRHDADYVDAYYGPTEWKAEAQATIVPLVEIRNRAERAREAPTVLGAGDELDRLRQRALDKQLAALVAKAEMLDGRRMTFDEESAALYDVVAPRHEDATYQALLEDLDALLPNGGTLSERYDAFRARFTIPSDRLDRVFDAAIEAARSRTKEFIDLPEGESFRTEMVKGQVWGAYNWYEGNAHSLIQVNTDLPMAIDAPLHLACHEGYPGHHVYNALLEKNLARDRGWVEFTVYPLYSPQSLIAEGTAEYGFELAFSLEERRAFERDVLYPLAGLDPAGADDYDRAVDLVRQLGAASNDAARRYLDGESTREETAAWLVEHAMLSPARADQRIRFFEHNRSYVVTYRVGLDLIRRVVEAQAEERAKRWEIFTQILSTPQTPSGLLKSIP